MKTRKLARRTTCLALVLGLSASFVATAQARHAQSESAVATPPLSSVDAALRHHHPEVSQPPTRIVAVPSAEGFDWADAGIGAGVASVTLVLTAGLAVVVTRRSRRTSRAERSELAGT
jgi:hypothetical protein